MPSSNDLFSRSFAIIGAGLAGIAAARGLVDRGAEVTLFEKSRGYGGRCASKRWENHVVDHGAQYFTMRDEAFRTAATAASGAALLRMEAPVLDENDAPLPDSGRWFHRDGNSRLARDLAKGLTVRTETTVEDARGLLKAHGGNFDHVISTAPWPQTSRMFGVEPTFDCIPCLAVLLAYRGDWLGRTRDAYAISDRHSELAWSACENHKPGRVADGFTVIVAHMSEAFSREHLERPPAEYPALVRERVEERWKLPSAALAASLGHRWRLARVLSPFTPPQLAPGLHFVGDALRRSRVEDAWLAGHDFPHTTSFAS